MMGNLAKYFGLIKETLLCGKQRDAAFGKKAKYLVNQKCRAFPVIKGLDQLSNSVRWRVMAFSHNGQGYLLKDLIFHQNFVFWP